MVRLVILRGLPGSGKSTYAEALLKAMNNYQEHLKPESLRAVRINKDIMRIMLNGGPFFGSDEHINNCMYEMTRYYLSRGLTVISDNMNFNPQHLERFGQIVNSLKYQEVLTLGTKKPVQHQVTRPITIEVHDFETRLAECVARNSGRPSPVPEGQIREVYETWCRNDTINGFPPLQIEALHFRHHANGLV